MPEKRRKFDPGFREGALRIVKDMVKPLAQVARMAYRVERAEGGDAPKRAPVEAVEAIRPAGVRADQGHGVGSPRTRTDAAEDVGIEPAPAIP